MAAYEGGFAIDNHDLAMVTEIELETVNEAARCKLARFDASRAQRFNIMARQIIAANPIIYKIGANALRRPFNQRLLEFPPQGNITHHKELNNHAIRCARDRHKNRCKGMLAIDQCAHLIAVRKGASASADKARLTDSPSASECVAAGLRAVPDGGWLARRQACLCIFCWAKRRRST